MLAPLELHRPTSVNEVLELRGSLGDDAALFCGGTELFLLMKMGLAAYGHLIDVKRVDGLRDIRADDAGLTIGAAVTHRQIERSEAVRDGWPKLAEMAASVANIRVRSVGSIGGNLCFADPHSDPATFLVAADASVCCQGPDGQRWVPTADFTTDVYETVLADDELLVSVFVPTPEPGTGFAHRKLAFVERPAVTAAVRLRVDAGVIADARVAVGSVGVKPYRNGEAEAQLVGGRADDLEPTRLAASTEALTAGLEPLEDASGGVEYKLQLTRHLTERTIQSAARDAVERA